MLNNNGKFAHENVETKQLLEEERRKHSAIKSKYISCNLLSKSQQCCIRKSIEVCRGKLWFFEQFNFKANKIEICNEEKFAIETIYLVGENNVNLPELTNENVDDVNMLLLVEEKFNTSDPEFKELSQLCVGMPTF